MTNAIIHVQTIIRGCYLVNLETNEGVIAQVLWGIVVDDHKRRWVPGNYVCTSNIIENMNGGVYRTKNTTYLCEGEGQTVALDIEALPELRAGYSPDEWFLRKRLRREGFQIQ